MKIEYLAINTVKLNPDNPRQITRAKMALLIKSLQECPSLFDARPLLISTRTGENIIIGGNMRYRAAKDLKYEKVPCVILPELTEAQEREIAIKDNGSFGVWDYDILANQWSDLPLSDWGLDIPDITSDENYSRKIETPEYKPNGENEQIQDLFDDTKTNELIKEIRKSNIDEEIQEFLIRAAARHRVFNYAKIANYYCNASKKIQDLMEKSALVIIDYDKAIANGYVKTIDEIITTFKDDYA